MVVPVIVVESEVMSAGLVLSIATTYDESLRLSAEP